MTIREWIRDREVSGSPTFSVEEIRLALPYYSEQVVENDLFHISSQDTIYPVYKGFYIIIPPHYATKRVVPPIYYIDQLISYLNKPYYISLLNAAEIHGTAHQRPQKFSVMSVSPKSSISQSKDSISVWVHRKEIPTDFLLSKGSEIGVIYYSSVELTALDIVQCEQYIGGFSRASTILGELTEKLDFRGASDELFGYTSITTIQQPECILDEVLDVAGITDTLHMELTSYVKRFKHVPLTINKPKDCTGKSNRRKIFVNTIIETDEIRQTEQPSLNGIR